MANDRGNPRAFEKGAFEFFEEMGEGVAQGQIYDWMRQWDLGKLLRNPGFMSALGRLFVKLPPQARMVFAAALGSALEQWSPRIKSKPLATAFVAGKFMLTAAIREIPQLIDEKIKDGEIDPQNLPQVVSNHLRNPFASIFASLNPFGSPEEVPAGDVVIMADTDAGDKDKKEKKDGEKADKPEVKAVVVAAKAVKKPLPEDTHVPLGLYRQILKERLADTIDRPLDPHYLSAYLAHLDVDKTPGAVVALGQVDLSDYAETFEALSWLADWLAEGGFSKEYGDEIVRQSMLGSAWSWVTSFFSAETPAERREREDALEDARRRREADENLYRRHTQAIYRMLQNFAAFEAVLATEADQYLTDFQRARLPVRETIDASSTARGRAECKRAVRNTGRTLGGILTSRVTIGLVILLLLVAFIGIPVVVATVALGMILFAGVTGLVSVAGMLTWNAYLVVGALVVIIGLRLVIVLIDIPLNLVRNFVDFLDPTDGTGLIGGTIRAIEGQLRNWGLLAPLTPAEAADRNARIRATVQKAHEHVGVFRDRGITVVIAWSVITAVWLLVAIAFGHMNIVIGFVLVAGAMGLVSAELYNRGWRRIDPGVDDLRMIQIEERRLRLRQMIRLSAIAAFTALILAGCAGAFGPENTEKAVAITHATTSQTLDRLAAFAGAPVTPRLEVCFADREYNVGGLEAEKGLESGSICADPRYASSWPCNCSARIWEESQECVEQIQASERANLDKAKLTGQAPEPRMSAWECDKYKGVAERLDKSPRAIACSVAMEKVYEVEDDKGLGRGDICADPKYSASWPCDCNAELWPESQRLMESLN